MLSRHTDFSHKCILLGKNNQVNKNDPCTDGVHSGSRGEWEACAGSSEDEESRPYGTALRIFWLRSDLSRLFIAVEGDAVPAPLLGDIEGGVSIL